MLSPLVQKEIVFRLLTTECGPKIRQIATGGSHIHQISRVIDWIKGNLSERLRVEDLASRAGMSGCDLAPPLPVVDCVESAAV